MKNIAGYWTGTFEGTNLGGVSFNIDQRGSMLAGVATMNEPTIGVYEYIISGQIGVPIILKLHPSSQTQNAIFGVIDAYCAISNDGSLLTGRWQSSIGTNGVFQANRYNDQTVAGTVKPASKSIFVSYSHTDKEFFDGLMVHLKPLEKTGEINAWSDQRIKAGSLWKREIEAALARTQVAILLISAEFLASDFIVDNELPPLLERAKHEGVRILPVILRTCRFTRDPHLGIFQAINEPQKPLAALQPWERDNVYDQIAHEIENLNS